MEKEGDNVEQFDTEGFRTVWKRVTESGGESSDDIGTLRKLLDEKATQTSRYEALLRYCRLSPLSDILREEKLHMRRMQTMHFILTGDTYAPKIEKDGEKNVLELLRKCHGAETKSLTLFRSAWNSCKNERLGETYAEILDDERQHIRTLEAVIEAILR